MVIFFRSFGAVQGQAYVMVACYVSCGVSFPESAPKRAILFSVPTRSIVPPCKKAVEAEIGPSALGCYPLPGNRITQVGSIERKDEGRGLLLVHMREGAYDIARNTRTHPLVPPMTNEKTIRANTSFMLV